MMKALPETDWTPVIRTDFADLERWKAVRRAIETPNEDEFLANVEFVDDASFQGLTAGQVVELVPDGYRHSLLVLADSVALASDEMPLLVIDLDEELGGEIRVIASELWSIENNLSLANMDFEEFTGAVDDDGIFRGF